jgi:hypothetical protein
MLDAVAQHVDLASLRDLTLQSREEFAASGTAVFEIKCRNDVRLPEPASRINSAL